MTVSPHFAEQESWQMSKVKKDVKIMGTGQQGVCRRRSSNFPHVESLVVESD